MDDMKDLAIEYRFSPRRRSIGLMVTVEGKLVVTVPAGASRESIARALEHHRDWIRAKAAARREAWAQLKEGMAFFLGRPYRLSAAPGAADRVTLAGTDIRVHWSNHGSGPWEALRGWYRRQARKLIQARVAVLAAKMGLQVGPVELREWKRRWGECHMDGKLRFNWRLILLPLEVVDYVVAHELAHLKVPGHGAPFWRQVERFIPDYATRRQWLNQWGSPFLLWQVAG